MNKRRDNRVHFIRSSHDGGEMGSSGGGGGATASSPTTTEVIPSIASIRRQYEERVMLLADGLTKILKDLQNDKVILQMDKDITTAPHVKERILEIIREALRSEQETVIQRLIEEMSKVETELKLTNEEYSRCQNALKQESTSRTENEKKINQLKLKLKDLVSLQTKTEGSKVNDLYEKVLNLEKELSLKENELKKKKKSLSTEKEENRQLFEQMQQKELEMNELRRKIEELVLEKEERDEIIEKLEHKTEKYKESYNEESKASKMTSKMLKKRLLEVEEQLKEKSEQSKEANNIVMRVQAKIIKYKERLEETERKREKLEQDLKRLKTDSDECLERERKAHNELQAEFSKRLNERLVESEKRIRDTFESKILSLERELHQKEALVQKSQFDQIYQQQMINGMKTLQPDQVDKMLELYESKLKVFQKDYLPRSDYDKKVQELETRFSSDKKDMEKKFEYELDYKLKELEQRKQKEFNNTLSSFKQGAKLMEDELIEERKTTKKLKKENLAKEEEIRSAREEIKSLEKKNMQLSSYLDESNRNIDSLRDYIDKQTHERKELEHYYSRMAEEVKMINGQLEEMKRHAENLDTIAQQKKQENAKLKEALVSETNKAEELTHEKQQLAQEMEILKKEHKIMSDTINYSLDNILLSLPSSDFRKFKMASSKIDNIEDLSKELGKSIEEFKLHLSRTTQDLKDKHAREIKFLEESIKKKKQKENLVEFKLRTEVSNLRRELDNLKQQTILSLSAWKQQFQTFTDNVLQKSYEVSSLKDNELMKKKQQYEKEAAELRYRYERDNQELSNALILKETELNQKIYSLQSELRDVIQDKSAEIVEKNNYLKKVEDLKRFVKLMAEHVNIPSDITSGILSQHSDIVERSMNHLSTLMLNFTKEREQQRIQLERMGEDFNNLRSQMAISEDSYKKLEKTKSRLQLENEKLKNLCEERYAEIVENLTHIRDEVQLLENRYEKDVKDSTIRARESFENQIKAMTETLNHSVESVNMLFSDKEKYEVNVTEIRRQLDEARRENEKKSSQILDLQKQRDQERQENLTLKKEVSNREKTISQLEREKEYLNLKTSKLEKKSNKLKEMMSTVAASAANLDVNIQQ
ncbi:hypothetical protein C9374_011405 [Naegleria lovaniensis]|uniref:Uncharacterized protein n=1 Tax=Naegleria lovaniensis TaxID=51637 RepID=A0AA88KWP1_NAELO|nr:uncharacterized protein C9374_011405 [Naegleria lovaniensis]KAG2392680.1 hypothetical protein C9374_011405 [Naegleria lovaniensis]